MRLPSSFCHDSNNRGDAGADGCWERERTFTLTRVIAKFNAAVYKK